LLAAWLLLFWSPAWRCHFSFSSQDRCFNTTDAPRKPCRSFCVDVGLTCANDPFNWINLCHNIECPTKEGKCSRDAENITL
jgi:hypothetical protein